MKRNWFLVVPALLAAVVFVSLNTTPARADMLLPPTEAAPEATVASDDPYAPPKLETPKPGPNMWVEFIAPTRAGIRRFYSSDGETFKVSRFAQVLTFGFEYSTGMFSVAVWDSVLDSTRFEVKQSDTFAECVGLFTSPGFALTLRPIDILSIELDAQYSFGIQAQEYPEQLKQHSFVGGLHVFVEPLHEYVGVSPRLRVGLGLKGGVAMVDAGDYKNEPVSSSAAAFMAGVTAGFVFPVTTEVSAHIGGGYYAGFDVHDGFGFGGHNIEWNFGLRWFPFSHTVTEG